MSSCAWHPEKPAVATIEGKQLCWACERQWHRLGYHKRPSPIVPEKRDV